MHFLFQILVAEDSKIILELQKKGQSAHKKPIQKTDKGRGNS